MPGQGSMSPILGANRIESYAPTLNNEAPLASAPLFPPHLALAGLPFGLI